jgi:hypothetical protein
MRVNEREVAHRSGRSTDLTYESDYLRLRISKCCTQNFPRRLPKYLPGATHSISNSSILHSHHPLIAGVQRNEMARPSFTFGLRSVLIAIAVVAAAIVIARPWVHSQFIWLQVRSERPNTSVVIDGQWSELPVNLSLAKEFQHPGVEYSADYTKFELCSRKGKVMTVVFVDSRDRAAFVAKRSTDGLRLIPMTKWRITSDVERIVVVGKE